jgi:predicted nucleic acid-binding protein
VIVADSSAIVELLLARPCAATVRAALAPHSELHVPEHFHVEVLSALRRYSVMGELPELRAAQALSAVGDLRAVTYPVLTLIRGIWDLRAALTAYDAAYLALARQLGTSLVTLDRGLATMAAKDGRLACLGEHDA